MIDTQETFLPPTPSEVFSVVMPTMADVDYFFGEASKLLKDHDNAKSLLSGRQLRIPVTRIMYKSFCDEILNRFIEQGWEAKWDWDHSAMENDDNLANKTLLISFTRKSHDPISEALSVAEWALEVEDTEHKAQWFDAVMSDMRKIVAILRGKPDGT